MAKEKFNDIRNMNDKELLSFINFCRKEAQKELIKELITDYPEYKTHFGLLLKQKLEALEK